MSDLDLDEIQKEISKAQEIETTINKLLDSGTPWVLTWHNMGHDCKHELTRAQEADLRKILIGDYKADFTIVERNLEKLITR